jgi:hypothetical protein
MNAAVLDLIEAAEDAAELLEARGEYTYEIIDVKTWVLGPGGISGNCETCVDNADRGAIPDEDVFEDSDGEPIDGPPAHPRCECELQYGERRRRVPA